MRFNFNSSGSNYLKAILLSLLLTLIFGMTSPLFAKDTGWYLLVPPRSNYNEQAPFLKAYVIFENKPLYQWHQQGAYDTAAECEDIKRTQTEVEQKTYSKSSEQYMVTLKTEKSKSVLDLKRSYVELWNANVLALMASRCIKSNDPRLKP